jgi:hypothetical protein
VLAPVRAAFLGVLLRVDLMLVVLRVPVLQKRTAPAGASGRGRAQRCRLAMSKASSVRSKRLTKKVS